MYGLLYEVKVPGERLLERYMTQRTQGLVSVLAFDVKQPVISVPSFSSLQILQNRIPGEAVLKPSTHGGAEGQCSVAVSAADEELFQILSI